VLVVFFVGLFLFVLGLYFTYRGGELQFGFDLSIVGQCCWVWFWRLGCCMLLGCESKFCGTVAVFRLMLWRLNPSLIY
jgi:hypothetical protein